MRRAIAFIDLFILGFLPQLRILPVGKITGIVGAELLIRMVLADIASKNPAGKLHVILEESLADSDYPRYFRDKCPLFNSWITLVRLQGH